MSLIYNEKIIVTRTSQIFTGTKKPDDTFGQNGDIYIKYTKA